jgi:hypothetical protein
MRPVGSFFEQLMHAGNQFFAMGCAHPRPPRPPPTGSSNLGQCLPRSASET